MNADRWSIEKCAVEHFGGNDLCLQRRLACRAVSAFLILPFECFYLSAWSFPVRPQWVRSGCCFFPGIINSSIQFVRRAGIVERRGRFDVSRQHLNGTPVAARPPVGWSVASYRKHQSCLLVKPTKANCSVATGRSRRRRRRCFMMVDRWSRTCLLYTSPSPRDRTRSRMPSSA